MPLLSFSAWLNANFSRPWSSPGTLDACGVTPGPASFGWRRWKTGPFSVPVLSWSIT